MKKLFMAITVLMSLTVFASPNSTNETIITGGMPVSDPPEVVRIMLEKFTRFYSQTDSRDYDIYVTTNINNKEMNLDCTSSDRNYLNFVNSGGGSKQVNFSSTEVCQLTIDCLKAEGQVELTVNTSTLKVEEANFSEHCHITKDLPFLWSF